MNSSKLHVNYSVTKSITSCLMGMLVDTGSISSVENSIKNYFPQYQDLNNFHEWKDEISINHILQMKAGFQWDEITSNYGTPSNSTSLMINSSDWLKHVLDQPMSHEPGTEYNYNSGCTVLMSGIIQNLTGQSAEEYAKNSLFKPLGITDYDWQRGPNNLTNTGFGLSLKPRDMVKFGQLYLNNGLWNGKQIISQDWIEKSFQPYTTFSNGNGYGYQWKMFRYNFGSNESLVTYANGHGNQYIFVVKELNMVIAITSENFNRGPSFINEILNDYIFESAM